MELQQSFRAVANAIDQVGPAKTEDFLARLVLILAQEINDAQKFEAAVIRALAVLGQEEGK